MIIHLSILGLIMMVSLIWEQRIKCIKLNAVYNGKTASDVKGPLTPWLIVFGYIAFLTAMRTSYNDTSVYVYSFEDLEGTLDAAFAVFAGDGKDKGFDFVGNIFKYFISDNYHVWFGFWAIIEAIILIILFNREATSFFEACFFFFSSSLYINNFSMMRQWFAVVVLFGASKFIKERRFIPFLIVCLLAAQIHNSAYLFIIVYFLVLGKPWSFKQNALLVIFVILIFFLNPLLQATNDLLQDSTYDYVMETMQSGNGSSIIRVFISAVPVIIAFLNRKYISNDSMIDLCVNMSVLNFLLNIVATFTSGLYVIRFATYMNMYNVILYPHLLNVALHKNNRKLVKLAFYTLFSVYYVYQMIHQGEWYYISDILGSFK